ncbi:T9SS type A sorting domain-containing protein [Flavobacterium sp. N2820]|uniref:DUF7619 domain-containing protein n=1 Tax=Flavobacterium sp. N2820 TaxID=2986834 RepID=UPI002224486B|nr:T9SS type A sorting domain-containing protein [Flavobacterium sp. N2820]
MKKIVLFLFFITTIAHSQIVNIPDANFKAKLLQADVTNNIASNVNPNNTSTWNIYTKVDTNLDGEIQYSEAQAIVYLNIDGTSSVNGGIQSLQGLEAFVNLKWLRSSYNQIITVDLSVCPQLEYFYASNSGIVNLGLTNCSNLQTLNCGYNSISSVDFTQCPSLRNLVIRNNLLTSLNLDTNQQIESIVAFYNAITNFQIQDKDLRTLHIGFNQLSNLQLVNLPFLYRVQAQNNNLTSVDFSTIAFQYEPNNLPQANVLDISVNNNVNLNHINLKNGYPNINISLSSGNLNNTQQYICVDDNDTYEYYFTTPNPIANTYCSFTPGGSFNTVSGITQFDFDNNGCDSNDIPVPFLGFEVNLNGVTTNSSVFTNNLGNYALFTSQQGVYELIPNLENPSYFTISPNPAVVNIPVIDDSTTTQNFCITANGVHPDLEIVIAPIIPARPGFEAEYQIVYKNKGNQVMSQVYGVNFFYNQNLMSFVSATQTPSSIVSGGMSWDFANLMPLESRSINVVMLINAPTATNPVNIGDVLQFTSSIMPMAGDELTTDNLFQFNQTVVGSYDPNDITCIEGDVVAPSYIGEYMHYVINFENTGTAAAENVVVKIEVNPNDFDINSLRILESSHNATIKITNTILEIIFQTIMLDTGGHGNVLLKVKSKENLVTNDIVTKSAKIYFDYNFPILTNDANTTFQVLSNSIPTKDVAISLYPNPTSSLVNIKAENTIKSTELYDVQGRLIQINKEDSNEVVLDISSYNSGIYFIKVTTDVGSQIKKIVKE